MEILKLCLLIQSKMKILKLTVKLNKLVAVSFLSSDVEFKMKFFFFLNQDFSVSVKNKKYFCVRDIKTPSTKMAPGSVIV